MIMVGMADGVWEVSGAWKGARDWDGAVSVKGHLYRGLGGDVSLGMVQEHRKRQESGMGQELGRGH